MDRKEQTAEDHKNTAAVYGFHTGETLRAAMDTMPDESEFVMEVDIGTEETDEAEEEFDVGKRGVNDA